MLDEGIWKDVPWVGWVFKAKNIYNTVSDRLFLAKIMSFILSIDEISSEEKSSYIAKIDEDPKFRNKLHSTLLLILEKINDIEKPAMLAKVFSAYLKNYISFDDFHLLADSINTAYIGDLNKLVRYKTEEGRFERLEFERLYRSNLSEIQKDISFSTQAGGSSITIEFKLSEAGDLLRAILQNKIKERVESAEQRKLF